MQKNEGHIGRFSAGMFLVTIGIVYGDIGTSPMYVMKSIVEGNGGIANVDETFIVGSLSLVIWTITLLTTVKHVLIALRADNHGEGGIFALYSLVKDCGAWLIVPTMVGGCTMLESTAWSAMSKPVAQMRDLKPSQCTATIGTLISAFRSSTTLSMSSPMMPVAHELVTKIALGE